MITTHKVPEFTRQFEHFDPLHGEVPYHPFLYLPEIAVRARAQLKSRSVKQIKDVALKIETGIRQYFYDFEVDAVQELKNRMSPGKDDGFEDYFFWYVGSKGNGEWVFKETMLSTLDVPTWENTSEFDALKALVDNREGYNFVTYVKPYLEDFQDGSEYELFAVISLSLVSDALISFQQGNAYLQTAAGYAMKAMDAVCYAEQLSEVEWLVSYAMRENDVGLLEEITKQKTVNLKRTIQIRDRFREALKNEKSKEQSKRGKAGKAVQDKAMDELRLWTLNRYQKLGYVSKNMSANAAAYELKDEAIKYGKSIVVPKKKGGTTSANLTEANAQRTIAVWLNKAYPKPKKTKK